MWFFLQVLTKQRDSDYLVLELNHQTSNQISLFFHERDHEIGLNGNYWPDDVQAEVKQCYLNRKML